MNENINIQKQIQKRFSFTIQVKDILKFLGRKKVIILALIIVLIGLPVILAGRAALNLYRVSLEVKDSAYQVKQAIANQNLDQLETSLEKTRQSLSRTKSALAPFIWAEKIPKLGRYIKDSQNLLAGSIKITDSAIILTQSLKPHADLLGLKGRGTFKGGTIQERLVILSETLEKQSGDIQKAVETFHQGSQLILSVDPKNYPPQLFKKPVRPELIKLENKIRDADSLLMNIPATIKIIPALLGSQKETKYLILLQNNAELRPTGGFITAYAQLSVKRGLVTNSFSEDIYSLDRRFRSHIPAPKPIKEYLVNIPYWYLRDMNLSPDFKTSMETFYPNYLKVGQPADVIIAIDTNFVTKLINILGPVQLPGYGTFSNQINPDCNCAQVIYKLERIIDQPRSSIIKNRKSILSPLMQALINKTLTAPHNQWPKLIQGLYQLAQEKHILVYSPENNIQKVAQDWNFAGQAKPFKGDYFLLVDSNMGGAKSNLYIQEEVKQKYTIDQKTGLVKKTAIITYRNPQSWSNCNLEKGGLCLNGEYRDWIRLYVPRGSKLIKVANSLTKATVSTNLGKTVFEAYIKLRPPGFYRLTFTYLLPFKWQDWPQKVLIQKQGGSKNYKYELNIDQKKLNFILDKDKVINLKKIK